MTYKTILVHLNNERRTAALTEYAVGLAERLEAHVVGLYIFPAFRLMPPLAVPMAKELAARLRGEMREEESRVRSVFQAMSKGHGAIAEWRPVTSERRSVASVVIEHARAADLVVASQTDSDWGFSEIIDCPDRIAIESGRPLLQIPNAGRFKAPPERVVVAWNGRREAARALFDALPLLKLATSVEVVTVKEARGSHERDCELPDTEIASALSRHGIKASLKAIPTSELSAAHALRDYAADSRADLMVMGAYGHARLTEFVFGGATRHLMQSATLPVLFSH